MNADESTGAIPFLQIIFGGSEIERFLGQLLESLTPKDNLQERYRPSRFVCFHFLLFLSLASSKVSFHDFFVLGHKPLNDRTTRIIVSASATGTDNTNR